MNVRGKSVSLKGGRNVSIMGNVVRLYGTGVKSCPLFKLDFTPAAVEYIGGGIAVGDYELRETESGIQITDADGNAVFSEYAEDATVKTTEKDFSLAALEGHKTEARSHTFKTQLNVALSDDAAVYGLGDKAAAVNRRGYEYVQWNTDDPSQHNESYKSLYKSINYVLVTNSHGCFGIFYPDPRRAVFDLGAYKPDLLYIASEKGDYDFYIIVGKTPREVTGAYTKLVGLPLLPRLKMLGYQQSRWSYSPQSAVEELADRFKENDIPIDYIHLDIDYMDGYRVYTVEKSRFPDMKGLSERLGEQGIELVTILDPGVKYDTEYSVYNTLKDSNGLATRDGEIYHNAVWPGDSVYPNYFDEKVAAAVAQMTAEFMKETGVTGIWCDMNEPASFNGPLPDDVMFGEYAHEYVHNLYGDAMVRAVSKSFDALGMRPYVITRACFATSSPYTVMWNGDNQSLWAHLRASLPQIATMGICGFPYDGVDVGGFGNECNKELLIRWIEANIFSPFLRNHSSIHTRDQEPYAFDSQTLEIYKKFLRLRYDLAPYMYDLSYSAHLYGEPIVRPMFYEYPEDANCRTISDQIMIGDSLMLAPVLDPGVNFRAVYFPKGKWKPIGAVNASSDSHKRGLDVVKMPLDSTGLYMRSDAVIPMYRGLNNLSVKPDVLYVLLGGKEGRHISYEDDGKTVGCGYNVYEMTYDGETFSLKTLQRGYETDYKKLVLIRGKYSVEVPFDYNLSLKIK